jgi:two-component system, OmpR family, response regulator MprA
VLVDAVRARALGKPIARVRALLRRPEPPPAEVLEYGDLTLCTKTRVVRRSEREFDLTPIEFDLLELFLRNPGRVLSRGQIFTHVWGYDFGASSNSLTVYIGYLRRKTEAAGEPRLIHNVRGVGYVLQESPKDRDS